MQAVITHFAFKASQGNTVNILCKLHNSNYDLGAQIYFLLMGIFVFSCSLAS